MIIKKYLRPKEKWADFCSQFNDNSLYPVCGLGLGCLRTTAKCFLSLPFPQLPPSSSSISSFLLSGFISSLLTTQIPLTQPVHLLLPVRLSFYLIPLSLINPPPILQATPSGKQASQLIWRNSFSSVTRCPLSLHTR